MLRKTVFETQTGGGGGGGGRNSFQRRNKSEKVSHKDVHVKVTEQHFSFPGSAKFTLIFSADVLCGFGKCGEAL